MKYILLVLILTSISNSNYSQDYLCFTKKTYAECSFVEDSLGSKKLPHCVERVMNLMCSPNDSGAITNPVAFRRKIDSPLPLTIEYYFRNRDSSICSIFYIWEKTYDWDLDSSSIYHKHNKMSLQDYNKIFNVLNTKFISILGIPSKSDKRIVKTKFKPNQIVYSRVSWWKLGDRTIHLKMVCDDIKSHICTRAISAQVIFN